MAENSKSTLLEWYDSRHPRYLDLVGDYAGKELFLVDGDSMLRQCFEDDRIDFHDGFQILHAVFVVERFLDNLIKRHCNFHLGFFDDHQELCIPSGVPQYRQSRYLLARSVVIRHLSIHLPRICKNAQVHIFSSLASDGFGRYLAKCPIHFVMVHDGAPASVGKSRKSTKTDRQTKVSLLSIIFWLNSHKLNVALLNCIEFRDSKVFTMILVSKGATNAGKFDLPLKKRGNNCAADVFSIDSWLSEPPIQSLLEVQCLGLESWLLTVCAICALLSDDTTDIFLASAFILHTILLKRLNLSQRRLPDIEFDEDFEESVGEFLDSFAETTRWVMSDTQWTKAMTQNGIESDVIDFIDGRLFRCTIRACQDGSLDDIPETFSSEWSSACDLILALTGKPLSLECWDAIGVLACEDDESGNGSRSGSGNETFEVMTFRNSTFDKHLECIHVEGHSSLPTRLDGAKVHRELTHWHNHRKPLNPVHNHAEKVSKWRNPSRTNQFYMAEMTSYAASLSGSKGKILEPEIITVGPKKVTINIEKVEEPQKISPKLESSASGAKKGGKKATAGLSNAQLIIANNRQKKGGVEAEKAFLAWIGILKSLDDIPGEQERYLRAKTYLDGLDAAKLVHVDAEINLYLVQCLFNWWAKYCKVEKKTEGYHVVALLWTAIRSICASKSPLTKEIVQHTDKVSTLLGITNAETVVTNDATLVDARKLSFTFKYPPVTQSYLIDMSQVEFQLLHCGPYMDRHLDAKPDPRVSSFIPDGWQRKVLDELDANHSVFVVAPTSAGKTFISFYAMEQVLREGNDGVLVYVAPTKALVNQIAAEVQARFSKKYPNAGKSVWAIHTRDYRVNSPTGCQILVTVPHILQIMLLAPTNANSWAPRLQRIIFDEIHSIGAAEDGVVWEQLLLLAPSPVICLSATVGNPEQFSDWLSDIQKVSNTPLTMIKHSTRYSDLRKYTYQPPKAFNFEGLGRSRSVGLGLDGLEGLKFFHPVASLVDKSRGMPDDLALEPRDCLLLWKALCRYQTDDYKVPKSLDPKHLPPIIKKVDVFKWEKDLKATLTQWMVDEKSPFEKVIAELSSPSIGTMEPVFQVPDKQGFSGASAPSNKISAEIDQTDLCSTTLPLLLQLHQRQALPAILFNYDRKSCEDIGESLLNQLKVAEDNWKDGKEWKNKIQLWTKWKEQKERKTAKKPAKASRSKGGDDDERTSKTDQARDTASSETSWFDLFDPDEPQEEFSFADNKKAQKSEIDTYIKQLRWKNVREAFIELIQRGIGVHHSGMNRKYRQCVEMLFRKGYLRVVIATGTLSLGINMPCATVVFSGDSVFLTALNFRQASGRSGRRGFDLLGNVVFQGVTYERVCRLLSSRLPDLIGHFPITTTLVLRLFMLLNGSKNSPYAVRAVDSLLSQPRLYLGGESFREQVLHHLRFSIEYLRRQSLLGPRGEPVNFTSCVAHLYFTENSAFAFHALLIDGYLSNLCADIDRKTDYVLRTLMLVLSHIFGRKTCKETDDEKMAEIIRRSPSIVYLPPLPTEAAKALLKHNANTLDVFATYVKTFAEQHMKGEENELPLSKVQVGFQPMLAPENTSSKVIPAKLNGHAKPGGRDEVITRSLSPEKIGFLPVLPRPLARSAFVALSGHGDDFITISDLCSSAHSGIFLESAVIPHLELHPEESRVPLNAYLFDFYMHGSVTPLEVANGIKRSDVWFVLNDFSMVLATICTSLALYLGLTVKVRGGEDEMLDVMGSGDAGENDKDDEEAAARITTTPLAQAPVTFTAKKAKKVVPDDWNADEDETFAREKRIEEVVGPATGTDNEEYEKLLNVYQAFRKLKNDFDMKFKEIWA